MGNLWFGGLLLATALGLLISRLESTKQNKQPAEEEAKAPLPKPKPIVKLASVGKAPSTPPMKPPSKPPSESSPIMPMSSSPKQVPLEHLDRLRLQEAQELKEEHEAMLALRLAAEEAKIRAERESQRLEGQNSQLAQRSQRAVDPKAIIERESLQSRKLLRRRHPVRK